VLDAKRLIGRKMKDPEIQRDVQYWPIKVKERSGKPVVGVKYKGKEKECVCSFHSNVRENSLISIVEISAMVLGKMKETAEAYLGHKATHAVNHSSCL
jgi:heat shock protein 5